MKRMQIIEQSKETAGWNFCREANIKVVFALVFIFSNLSIYGQIKGWVVSDPSPVRYYRALSCSDSMNCVSAAYNENGGRFIRKTTDGGINWTLIYFNKALDSLGDFEFSDIVYKNSNLILAVTMDGLVIRSKDSGLHWDFSRFDSNLFIQQVIMLDENYGWLTGYTTKYVNEYYYYNEYLYRTSDGGDTWKVDSLFYKENISGFLTIADAKKNKLVAFGYIKDSSFIFHSVNNGQSWDRIPTHGFIRDFYFIDEMIGWSAGGIQNKDSSNHFSDTIREKINKTTDGGSTWFSIRDTFAWTSGFSKIRFSDKNNGLAGGYAKLLLRTTDGGINWFKEKIGKENSYRTIMDLEYPAFNHAYAILAMEDLYRYDSSVGVSDKSEESQLCHIYPNPVKKHKAINLSLSSVYPDRELIISIYNVLGEEVYKTIHFNYMNYTIKLEPELMPGLYVLKMNNDSRYQKFIVID